MFHEWLYPLHSVEGLSFLNLFKYITVRSALAAVLALLISFVLGPPMIAWLRHVRLGQKVREDAGGKSFEEFYLPGYAMIDMQIDHITRCELPLSTSVGDRGWYYNYGTAEGTSEEAFDIVALIGQNK